MPCSLLVDMNGHPSVISSPVTRSSTGSNAFFKQRSLQRHPQWQPFARKGPPPGTCGSVTQLNRPIHCQNLFGASASRVSPRFTCRAQQVALEGDLVYIHFDCKDETGQVVDSSREGGEPLSFEVGAGDVFSNDMIKAFDGAVRGLAVGEKASIAAAGNPWNQDLLFAVARDHPEMQRLEGRYKNVGGLAANLVVELANGNQALILEVTDDLVKLDANPMLAGKRLEFEIEVMKIEPDAR